MRHPRIINVAAAANVAPTAAADFPGFATAQFLLATMAFAAVEA